MPELPEVETIVSALQYGGRGKKAIPGEMIIGGKLDWAKTLAIPDPQSFWTQIINQRIEEVSRRGKFIRIDLNNDSLLFHLRMSGDLLALDMGEIPPAHTRLCLDFKSGRKLAFRNVRKFGRAWLLEDPGEILNDLGPEPFDPILDVKFPGMLKRRKRQIKPLLMDQNFLAGLGNIYTDESLHLARIHPLQSADTVSDSKALELLQAIRAVLQEAIIRNGTSIDWMYAGGDYQEKLRVYKRDGSSCLFCGTEIHRIIVGQRGTHYCPTCQKLTEPEK